MSLLHKALRALDVDRDRSDPVPNLRDIGVITHERAEGKCKIYSNALFVFWILLMLLLGYFLLEKYVAQLNSQQKVQDSNDAALHVLEESGHKVHHATLDQADKIAHPPMSQVIMPPLPEPALASELDSLLARAHGELNLTSSPPDGKDALARLPQQAPAVEEVDAEETAIKQEYVQNTDELYRLAAQDVEHNHQRAALTKLELIVTKSQDFAPARELLAKLLLAQGELSRAEEILSNSIYILPDNVVLKKLYARLLMGTARHQQALSVLEINKPELSSDAEHYALMANIYENLGDYERAGDLYLSLVKHYPENATYWLGVAIFNERQQQHDLAVQAYAKVLEADKSNNVLKNYARERMASLKVTHEKG